jgi:hypothetical protein
MREDEKPGDFAQAIVMRARGAVGAAFRPQGRSIECGLDCIGLAALALAVPEQAVPSGYRLRGGRIGALRAQLSKLGLDAVASGDGLPGDLAVFQPGPGQIHLAILTGPTLIHADAALRRVVERPLPAPWPALGLWRTKTDRRSD